MDSTKKSILLIAIGLVIAIVGFLITAGDEKDAKLNDVEDEGKQTQIEIEDTPMIPSVSLTEGYWVCKEDVSQYIQFFADETYHASPYLGMVVDGKYQISKTDNVIRAYITDDRGKPIEVYPLMVEAQGENIALKTAYKQDNSGINEVVLERSIDFEPETSFANEKPGVTEEEQEKLDIWAVELILSPDYPLLSSTWVSDFEDDSEGLLFSPGTMCVTNNGVHGLGYPWVVEEADVQEISETKTIWDAEIRIDNEMYHMQITNSKDTEWRDQYSMILTRKSNNETVFSGYQPTAGKEGGPFD